MKFLSAVLALAVLSSGAAACKHYGDKCSKADYDNVTTHCECNTGKLLFCGNDVLKDHYSYEVLLNCKKPPGGGLQCVDNHCNKGKKLKRDVTPEYAEEFRNRLLARDPVALALEDSGDWTHMQI